MKEAIRIQGTCTGARAQANTHARWHKVHAHLQLIDGLLHSGSDEVRVPESGVQLGGDKQVLALDDTLSDRSLDSIAHFRLVAVHGSAVDGAVASFQRSDNSLLHSALGCLPGSAQRTGALMMAPQNTTDQHMATEHVNFIQKEMEKRAAFVVIKCMTRGGGERRFSRHLHLEIRVYKCLTRILGAFITSKSPFVDMKPR